MSDGDKHHNDADQHTSGGQQVWQRLVGFAEEGDRPWMISSICRRRTSRETVAATDGSICSITRSRSEAGITSRSVGASSRLGVNVGKGVGVPSRSRLPNVFIARAAF